MSLLIVSARCLRLVIGKPYHSPQRPYHRTLATKYTACRADYVSLERCLESRRAQARRSVLAQVSAESSCGELAAYCQQYGRVHSVHHYAHASGSQHFMLVEFEEESDAENLLSSGACHRRDVESNPIRTPFLWFRADTKRLKPKTEVQLATRNGQKVITEENLIRELQNCDGISQQMQLMYDRISLNDLGVRLRYMVARQLEMALSNLHANVAVKPFGSSVNGFGKMGCDLDLVLTNCHQEDSETSACRLIFHTKQCAGGAAEQWRRHLELAGDILRLCVPGCTRVRNILQARIPIIKYMHELAAVECDLCANNMSGVYMSELLYLYGSLDTRVRPLVFAVRKWASTNQLTTQSPGPWITNFPLTLMVLFFLQQDVGDGAILPPLQYLVERASKEDIRITEDHINCTFLRDLSKLPADAFTQNKCELGILLMQFFEFYSKFDFESYAISVVSGKQLKKPQHSALHIVNPLEQSLNVSRNVNFKECERLRLEIRSAAWQLEGNFERSNKESWGLIDLIEKRSTRAIKDLVRVGNSHRLVKVTDLFKEENVSDDKEFKNKQVEREVKKIREEKKAPLEVREKMLRTNETSRRIIRRR